MDDNGPFYTQLGFSSTLAALKQLFVDRLGAKEGEVRLDLKFWYRLDLNVCLQVRMEKVKFAAREGATSEGCPIAKWVRQMAR